MGALGISRETVLDLASARRTITSAPPAETFTAVANSSDSLPLSSRLRTNTGIASCNLGHFLRSSVLAVEPKLFTLAHGLFSSKAADYGPNAQLAGMTSQIGLNHAAKTGIFTDSIWHRNWNWMPSTGEKCNSFRFECISD